MSFDTKKVGMIAIVIIIVASVGIGLWLWFPQTPVEPEVFKIAQLETGDLSFSWARLNHESITRIAGEFNTSERRIEVSVSFHIAAADFGRVAETYILDGYDLIIGSDVVYESTVAELAAEYPNVMFIGLGGWTSDSATGNVSVMSWDIWKGYYFAGIIAGAMTTTNKLGWVSAFEFPDNARIYNMFLAGATEYNDAVTGQYLFTGDWHDSIGGATAASTLIDAGADVVAGTGGGLDHGVITECIAEGVYAIGYDYDAYELGPDALLTSVVYNRDAYFRTFLEQIFAGTFGGDFLVLGIEDGATDIAPYHQHEDDIPQDARDLVDERRAAILAGTFSLPVVEATFP